MIFSRDCAKALPEKNHRSVCSNMTVAVVRIVRFIWRLESVFRNATFAGKCLRGFLSLCHIPVLADKQ